MWLVFILNFKCYLLGSCFLWEVRSKKTKKYAKLPQKLIIEYFSEEKVIFQPVLQIKTPLTTIKLSTISKSLAKKLQEPLLSFILV